LINQGENLTPGLSFTEIPDYESDSSMQRAQPQNCFVPLRPMPAKPHRNYPDHSKKVSHVLEVEQMYVIKFFVEEGIKRV
jgi:hypothetical protein